MQGDGGVDGIACKKIKSFSLRGNEATSSPCIANYAYRL